MNKLYAIFTISLIGCFSANSFGMNRYTHDNEQAKRLREELRNPFYQSAADESKEMAKIRKFLPYEVNQVCSTTEEVNLPCFYIVNAFYCSNKALAGKSARNVICKDL